MGENGQYLDMTTASAVVDTAAAQTISFIRFFNTTAYQVLPLLC